MRETDNKYNNYLTLGPFVAPLNHQFSIVHVRPLMTTFDEDNDCKRVHDAGIEIGCILGREKFNANT